MIAESDRARDTGKPEDEAQRLLQEAQNELELANKTWEELLKEQAKIQDELEQMRRRLELSKKTQGGKL